MKSFLVLLAVLCYAKVVLGFSLLGLRLGKNTEIKAYFPVKWGNAYFNGAINSWGARESRLEGTVLDEVSSGPILSDKKRKMVGDYMESKGGKRVIQRVLIANNGMAATKSILSMRQWAYKTFGDERAIEFVAMATRDDLNANAEFIRLADTFVEVPPGSNTNNYASVDLILDIALSQKVDGVWPGWGHASENPALPARLAVNGIQFIGPTAPVMAALGDKVSANILAQTAKVPSVPWSGDGINSQLNAEGIIAQEDFDAACIFNVEQAAECATKIGYPVMIKASEGGGGKGIRMAHNEDQLRTNYVQVVNEVPGSPVFMMQLCSGARHLEVQIVGDEYGNAVALNGRDCSTQRRFQKIFEEGPPIVAPKDVFRHMELSALRLTQSIGYIGAGTVEYLYSASENKYYFLELNPRLQVEHPVTEGLTGVNLPSVQLQVAMGIPLDHIPDIRKFFGRSEGTSDPINFLTEEYVHPELHVLAARITAENPDEGFKPTSGSIERIKFQSSANVWGYFSVGADGGIHEFADSQFGHLFASGPTREDARKALVLALKEIEVRGDIRTPVEYLIQLLETQEFKDNTIDTSWLDGIIREKSVEVPIESHTVAMSAAVFRAYSFVECMTTELKESLLKGQRSLQGVRSMLAFPVEITYEDIKYNFNVRTLGTDKYELEINGQILIASVRKQPDKSLLCSINGDNYQLFGQDEALGLRMRINSITVMIPTVFNPSELRSDVKGKVVRYLHQDGDFVDKDEPYVEVEAMKMIIAIKATEKGTITHNISPGSVIEAGDLIASLQLADPEKVKHITIFKDRLSVVKSPPELSQDEALEIIRMSILGYENDHEAALSAYLAKTESAEHSIMVIIDLIEAFLTSELQFDGLDAELVIAKLSKENKDALDTVVSQLVAHKQVKYRCTVLLSLLQQLGSLLLKVPANMYGATCTTVANALSGVTVLSDDIYGEVSLLAQQLVDWTTMPSFQIRLDNLLGMLKSGKMDTRALSKEPSLSVSVDLLTVRIVTPILT